VCPSFYCIPICEAICIVSGDSRDGNKVWVNYKENGSKVTKAYLLYSLNGGERYEEWFRIDAIIVNNETAKATLPEGTSHYVFNLVDEYQFMVSHPNMGNKNDFKKGQYAVGALALSDNN